MVTDIHPALLGPHALAIIEAKKTAMVEWGINPLTLVVTDKKSLARSSRVTRQLMVSSEYESENV